MSVSLEERRMSAPRGTPRGQRRIFVTASLLALAGGTVGGCGAAEGTAADAARERPLGPAPEAPLTDAPLPDGRRLARDAAIAFGTTVSVTAVHEDRAHAARAARAAINQLLEVDRLMSLHRADSPLVRLNREGVLHAPDRRLLEVLEFSLRLAQASGGAFDPSVQPLWALHAGARAQGRVPSPAELATARQRVGWQRIELSPRRIRLAAPGMQLTLNGVAQGLAADLALASLRDAGIADAILDAGELGHLGQRAPGRPWTVGIAHPRRPGALVAEVALDGRFLSTSGDYATTFTPDFRLHHVLDPRTGVSPGRWSSVTVAARSGLEADGLSTALMVLERDRGQRLLAGFGGAGALWVDKHVRAIASHRLAARAAG